MKKRYNLITKTEELEGTIYFEFLPGKYHDKCWNEKSVFLTVASIVFIEDFLHQICSDYDRYSFTEMNSEQIKKLTRLIDFRISEMQSKENYSITGELFSEDYYINLNKEFIKSRALIIISLKDLCSWFKEIIISYDRITVMGL